VTVTVLVWSSVRTAVSLFFEPITRLWRHASADYRDLAAREFLLDVHALVSRLAITVVEAQDTVVVTEILRMIEGVLMPSVARVADLSSLAVLVSHEHERADSSRLAFAVHAAFVAGYLTGLLTNERLPSRYIRSMSELFRCHTAVLRVNRRLWMGQTAQKIA